MRHPVACAVYHGKMRSLKWLLDQGWKLDEDALCAAIDGQQEELFIMITEERKKSPSYDYHTLKIAEKSTLPSVKEWLRWMRYDYKRGPLSLPE